MPIVALEAANLLSVHKQQILYIYCGFKGHKHTAAWEQKRGFTVVTEKENLLW
jgi:hypothetical protein